MRRIAVLDAPSNLGLRPPTATSVPGCAKAPGALRDQGLLTRLHARDAGCLTPPRYDPGDWRPGDGVAHAAEIAAYSRALADRIGAILDAGEFPVVLGGDCSILLGSGIAMHRLGEAVGGRIGLVFVDGHSDFRHPGNASYVGAAAGEDLALVTGRGQVDLAGIEGRRPYFRDIDVIVIGIRAQDEYRLDLQAAGIVTRPVPALRVEGAARSAQWARDQLVDCAGYWVHVDVDVLDPAVMPAVDAPSPGGIAFPELELLLAGLVESPHCLGVEITVFDPDYDPDGSFAAEITATVTAGLAVAHTVTPRPDLIAARQDLSTVAADDPEGARRPAAAAAGSGTLAVAGISPGPAEPEVPATTLLDVEEAGDRSAAENDRFSEEYRSGEADEDAYESGEPTDSEDPGDATSVYAKATADPADADSVDADRADADRADAPDSDQANEYDVGLPGSYVDEGAAAIAIADIEGADVAVADVEVDRIEDADESDRYAVAEQSDHFDLGPSDHADLSDHADPSDHIAPDHHADPSDHAAPDHYIHPDHHVAPDHHIDPDHHTDPDHHAAVDDRGLGVETDSDHRRGPDHHVSLDHRAAVDYYAGPDTEADSDPHAGPDHHADHEAEADPEAAFDERGLDERGLDGDELDGDELAEGERPGVGLLSRPLGSAPLLDSQPLPATRPGMLRPRVPDDSRPGETFTLPIQRPAFDVGSDEPADMV